mmetsp:Transcript_43787/g.171289  ORF Transcript_43787/g.171289 Transcript_43787/m.171289 type:complete len:82 (-) Transcript_43787:27-272(-)
MNETRHGQTLASTAFSETVSPALLHPNSHYKDSNPRAANLAHCEEAEDDVATVLPYDAVYNAARAALRDADAFVPQRVGQT